MTEIALIAAVARNGIIGRGQDLVFRDPADQQHFRNSTMGHPVVMGRKTWDSLPPRFRPLPGRRNVVVSRNAQLLAPGAEVALGLGPALHLLQGVPKVFIAGGAELYALALPFAQTLVLTEVDADLEGDIHFPAWDRAAFETENTRTATSAQGLPMRFVTYRRIGPTQPFSS